MLFRSLMLIFLIFGIIAGYRNMFREMKRIQRKEAEAAAEDVQEHASKD